MKKHETIDAILEAANIHHNISTRRLKLPETPENMPEDIAGVLFHCACETIVHDIVDEVEQNTRSDKGNRNLCGCPTNGEKCQKHDIWHVYQHGRRGATLYWAKYWETGQDYHFKLYEDDLKEATVPELKGIMNDLKWYHNVIEHHKQMLYPCLEDMLNEWTVKKEEENRKRAMGYYETLEEMLSSNNDKIVRLAKGIKKEFTK